MNNSGKKCHFKLKDATVGWPPVLGESRAESLGMLIVYEGRDSSHFRFYYRSILKHISTTVRSNRGWQSPFSTLKYSTIKPPPKLYALLMFFGWCRALLEKVFLFLNCFTLRGFFGRKLLQFLPENITILLLWKSSFEKVRIRVSDAINPSKNENNSI